jgi:basic membrane protein A
LASGDAELIVTGSFSVLDVLEQTAALYPDKNFVIFDAAVNPQNCGNACENVYSITYRSNEAGFLAGILAGLMEVNGNIDRIAQTGVVGVVGGQDIPVINDYIEGFKSGVSAVAPDVTVLSAYAGSFVDPVKGKAVADDMIAQGAEVIFTAAGATDNGIFESAAEANVWAIGNARSQAESVDNHGSVLAAADTNVTSSLADAVRRAAAGDLPFGEAESFGVREGAISLVPSPAFDDAIPADVKSKLDEQIEAVANGEFDAVLRKG